MSNKQKTEVIIIQESIIGSIIKDIVTFSVFGGLLYFNHKVLSGNGWIDAIFMIFVFLYLSALKSSQVFKGNKEEAIKWLNGKE